MEAIDQDNTGYEDATYKVCHGIELQNLAYFLSDIIKRGLLMISQIKFMVMSWYLC